MDHYDGPAFYRKFPVKPTPVKREDPITERAESQVKQRQRRNTQPTVQTPAERPSSPATSPRATRTGETPTSTTETKPTPSSANYRPFQVTEVPKQLHWSQPANNIRQRYQDLIDRLHKADDSFLLFATADATLPTAQGASSSELVSAGVDQQRATVTPTSPASVTAPAADAEATTQSITGPSQKTPAVDSAATTDSLATTQSAQPVSRPTTELTVTPTTTDSEKKTTFAETITPSDADPVNDSDSVGSLDFTEPAPTEIFYPENATEETDAEETSNDEADRLNDASPANPENQVTTDAAQDSDLADVKHAATESTKDALPHTTVTPADLTAAGPVDYLPVGSTSTPAPATRGGEGTFDVPAEPATAPAAEAISDQASAGSADEPLSATTASQAAANLDSDVQRLLARAEVPTDSNTELSAESAAPVDSVPADEPLASSAAAEKQPAPAVQSTVKKVKPTRGLGHSLGDIMQDEGNDQRDLALFADAAPAPVEPDQARGYHFPDLSLLPKPVVPDEAALDEWIQHQAEVLDATLNAFHVDAHVTNWTIGPTVTQFQVKLALGVKVNKITNLNDDLKLALAAKDIRIEAPIPGKTTVGIEIPNKKSRPVMLSEILNSAAFKHSESPLTVALGVDLFGQPQVTDLRKMPHGLIAGATGSGKSVFINSLLLSILYKANPQQVKLLLIDPKAVEMAPYDGLPHLLAPVISDPKAAAAALKWVVTEMDQRYEKLAAAGVRNIEQFNDRADANDEPGLKMPYIVIIIDELADLMMMAASEVQDYIVRITQKARAAGIHLLVATQRPSVDIVTGTIKNNIPTRIAFMVSSQIDSRTILDTTGAESLLGRGDMLYLGNGASQPMRLQGAFVEAEVDQVTDFVRTQGQPRYAFEPNGLLKQESAAENQDELLPKVLEYIAEEKTVSTSKLQRVFSIGYNRAANLIDDLEQRNYVSPQHGSKPREVYLTPDDLGKQLPEPHDQDAPFSS